MPVRVSVASHPDELVEGLCDQLAAPTGDPFASELVAVPSRGIERWLTQRIAVGLAERGVGDGICANVEFPTPAALVERVLEGVPALAATSAAWDGVGLTAHVIETIDHHLHEPWMGLLARHVQDSQEGAAPNRLAAGVKVARLFDRYSRRRPALIRAWAEGEDVGPDGHQLAEDYVWQPRLWRALRSRVAMPSLPELLPAGLDPIRTGEAELELPDRLAVYGLTSTDPLDLQVLVALGEQREVTLYVLHPSPALWQAVTPGRVVLPNRSQDPSRNLARHPLLRAWGRDARELQSVLAGAGISGDASADSRREPPTLLSNLTADIQANAEPGRLDLSEDDRTVQIHVCHGSRRQAEVLRDAILHLFAADPDLEPRDVVIMTPDLATFGPLLEAAFPHRDASGLPDLRLRIADRAPAATNPLVEFTARLLEVADSRMEASVVRELVDKPVVRHKFGFDADTAGEIVSLINDANIFWGIDGAHRVEWGLDAAEGTWRRGLDRVLAGVFYSDSAVRTVAGLAPVDGVEGQQARPAGILATLIDRLTAIRDMTGGARPMSEWAAVIAGAVRMLAAPAWDDEWQIEQLDRLLAETFPPSGTTADPDVTLGEVRQAVATWTEDRPSSLHLLTGGITLCTLVPMRSVPYRVVALLGMDESRFPRRGGMDGDDLLADHEVVGDRDPGSMDRQLLLDAVMAAGDHLLVTYSGADELSNTPIPPAVPVSELIDVLGQMVGETAMERVITSHPLQSFSDINFTPGELGVEGAWGFDAMQHRGATARQLRSPDSTWVDWPAWEEVDTIRLDDLIKFMQDPIGRFVQKRLGFGFPKPNEIPDDTLAADLDALSRWTVTNHLLEGLLRGDDLDGLLERERGGDGLPPGHLGDDDLAEAIEIATMLCEAARARGYDRRRGQAYTGSVSLGDVTVEGTVTADPDQGLLATVTPSRITGKRRIEAFGRLVFLSALRPDVDWSSVQLGKKHEGDTYTAVTTGPIKGDESTRRERARVLLEGLVTLYREGQAAPLPLPCETAFRWQLGAAKSTEAASQQAREAFEKTPGESRDPARGLVLGQVSSFEDLARLGFADYCARLWLPILTLTRQTKL